MSKNKQAKKERKKHTKKPYKLNLLHWKSLMIKLFFPHNKLIPVGSNYI